jgi:hypothetical protein
VHANLTHKTVSLYCAAPCVTVVQLNAVWGDEHYQEVRIEGEVKGVKYCIKQVCAPFMYFSSMCYS